jgi:beta-galactosidase
MIFGHPKSANNFFMFKLAISFIFLFSFSAIASSQTVDGKPAAIPVPPQIYNTEPWEDPMICGLNRDRARVTAYSFETLEDAISCDRENTNRLMITLLK